MWWGAEVAHDEGTSSCVVPVRSRSKSLVCSWEAMLSVFTLSNTGPSWSSVPTKLKCSWNQTDDNIRWVMYTRTFYPWPWPDHSTIIIMYDFRNQLYSRGWTGPEQTINILYSLNGYLLKCELMKHRERKIYIFICVEWDKRREREK